MKNTFATLAPGRNAHSEAAPATRASAAKHPSAKPTDAAARNAQLLEQRTQAVFRLRFQADSIVAAQEALLDVLLANLNRAGVKRSNPALTVQYNSYSPYGSGVGSLGVSVQLPDWSVLKNKGHLRLRDLLDGLPGVSRYDDGRVLHELAPNSRVTFSIALEQQEYGEDTSLVMLLATISQEKALTNALESLREAQETSSVAHALHSGSDADQKALQAETDLQRTVAELEQQLENKRDELRRASAKANEVRKRLREAETPTSSAIRSQLNALRDKLGVKHA
jgi:HPt (histidine-containing phosphotransfer) domain-containing protein